jgi:hypothetical protein
VSDVCPCCGKKIELHQVAIAYLARHLNPVNARTNCCNKIVRVVPRIVLDYLAQPDKDTDSWGQ